MERDRLWERRDAIVAKVDKLSLAMFTCAQFPDLAMLYDRKAVGDNPTELVKVLERFENLLSVIE